MSNPIPFVIFSTYDNPIGASMKDVYGHYYERNEPRLYLVPDFSAQLDDPRVVGVISSSPHPSTWNYDEVSRHISTSDGKYVWDAYFGHKEGAPIYLYSSKTTSPNQRFNLFKHANVAHEAHPDLHFKIDGTCGKAVITWVYYNLYLFTIHNVIFIHFKTGFNIFFIQ